MPRPPRDPRPDHCYHITTRCNGRKFRLTALGSPHRHGLLLAGEYAQSLVPPCCKLSHICGPVPKYSLSRKALPAVGSGFSAPLLDGTGSRDFEEYLGQSEVRGVSEIHEAAVIARVVGRGYYTVTVRNKVTPAVTRPFLRHHKADWTAR